MKVVLRLDVEGLGRKGDVCDVTNGYARNYLLPKGLALRSSSNLEKQAEMMRKAAALARAADQVDAEAIAVRLAPTVIEISARAMDSGSLYGSVRAEDIATAVKDQAGISVKTESVILDTPIRETGSHSVLFRLHEQVSVPVTVNINPE
ncbi:MAG: 50S ribosomal protein L9 [Acidimicrobiaceae bacterium]|nr:50S ribosomal protein L9 [Acidimicrobiaceae bacterium]